MSKKISIRLSPKLIYLTRKKMFRLKFLVGLAILFFLIYEIYTILQLPPYPYEPNQKNVDDLLTDSEFKKIFEPYLEDLKCSNNSMTLVAINSATTNFKRRQAIRDTWAKWVNEVNSTIIFFISKPKDANLAKQIEQENYYFNDLVLLPIKESYYLLTFKTLSIINWSINQCPHIKFLIKCDDDMFVNYPNLNKFLIANQNKTDVICGKPNLNSKPNRDRFSRWYMPYENYDKEYYPEFADGPIYILSASLLPKLLNATSLVKPIYLEDVYVTGLLREKVPGSKIIFMKDLMSYHFFKPSYCLSYASYSFHKIDSDGMRNIFNNYDIAKAQNTSLVCSFFTVFS